MSSIPSLDRLLAPGSQVMSLAERFRSSGHELYLVGGPVRDLWLKRQPPDIDFATDATPEETLDVVKPVAEEVWRQGERFGTIGCRVEGIPMEITTFRTEKYQPSSRHPEVRFESNIETDLSRRDFTVNAMAVRLPEKTAIDPFDGVKDLTARLLRTPIAPEESFSDDPLRMLRAFRFASQLEFDIAPEVLSAIASLKHLITTVSAERIRDELTRLLVGRAPGKALEFADATGITDLFLPELGALKLEQDPVHKHKDVFHHTLAVIERTDPVRELRLAALFHDVGKPKTRRIDEREGVSFHHHEIVGAKMARHRLRELRFPNHVTEAVTEVIRLHHRFHTYRLGWSDSAVRRYVRDAGDLLGTLNALVRADCTTRNPAKAKRLAARMDELEERIVELRKREEIDKIRPELDGRQVMEFLGVPPGPIIGRALAFLLEIRLEEGEIGEPEAYKRLEEWARVQGIEPGGEPPSSR
jgi:poly(A) polymerase